jgi:hypothetical protein
MATKESFSYRRGRPHPRIPVRKIRNELERIRGIEGGLTARAVVKHSRRRGAVLYSAFDWNVERAAMSHWLKIARDLITSVEVVYVSHGGSTSPAPAFVCVCEERGSPRQYEPLGVVMADDAKRHRLMIQVSAELRAIRRKHAALSAASRRLGKVWTAIDDLAD